MAQNYLRYVKRNDVVCAVVFPKNEFTTEGYRVNSRSTIARDCEYVVQAKYKDGWKDHGTFTDYLTAKQIWKETRGSRFRFRMIARLDGYRSCTIARN